MFHADFILDDQAQKLAEEAKNQVPVSLLERVRIAGKNF